MIRNIFPILIGVTLSLPCLAQNPPANPGLSPTPVDPAIAADPHTPAAITAATAFMNGLIRDSSVDNLMNLCSLPFCHDDSIIVTTRAELRNSLSLLLTASIRQRARTHPRVDSAYVLDIRKQAFFSMVPINIYFTVVNLKFTIGNKEASKLLILAVQITDEARIVGIED